MAAGAKCDLDQQCDSGLALTVFSFLCGHERAAQERRAQPASEWRRWDASSAGLVKFFGNLAVTDSPQQVCETYPAFQNKVFEMALDQDPVMTGVALDTLGLLGSTVEGKQVLQKTGERGS